MSGSTGITVVASITALQSLNTGVSLVYVEGYSGFADGGEGLFALGSSGTTNHGTIIVSANGTYYRQTDGGPLNVRWFGAKGNGTAADATAVQNCLNAAKGGSACVYVPAGTYSLAAQLVFTFLGSGAGLTFYGDGPDITNLLWASGQVCLSTIMTSLTRSRLGACLSLPALRVALPLVFN